MPRAPAQHKSHRSSPRNRHPEALDRIGEREQLRFPDAVGVREFLPRGRAAPRDPTGLLPAHPRARRLGRCPADRPQRASCFADRGGAAVPSGRRGDPPQARGGAGRGANGRASRGGHAALRGDPRPVPVLLPRLVARAGAAPAARPDPTGVRHLAGLRGADAARPRAVPPLPSPPGRGEPAGRGENSCRRGSVRTRSFPSPRRTPPASRASPSRARVDTPCPCSPTTRSPGLGRILRTVGGKTPDGARVEAVFRSHLAVVLKRMAMDGRGVAWLPLSLIGDELGDKRLVRAGGDGWPVPVEIRLVRRRATAPPAAEAFWRMACGTDNGAVSHRQCAITDWPRRMATCRRHWQCRGAG